MMIRKLLLFGNARLLYFFLLLFSHASYSNVGNFVADTSELQCMKKAVLQLEEAMSLMQKHYYKKDSVNWEELKTFARARISAAGSCEEAQQAVNWCFRQMNEKHSFIMPPRQAAVYNNVNVPYHPASLRNLVGEIKSELLHDKGIAYLSVPWVSTTDSAICTRVADSIQQIIANLDQTGITKWIVDLRNNRGGNCWPMLAGIGPLLGNGICGYFVSETARVPVSYIDGAAMQGRHVRCRVSKRSYQLKSAKKWIVVLTGPKTSSSGEIVTIAFKGIDQVFHYGEPTAGLTTGNTSYRLSDNSMLVLTVSREADRNGKIYDGAIVPDELIPSHTNSTLDDAAKSAAVMWLHIQ